MYALIIHLLSDTKNKTKQNEGKIQFKGHRLAEVWIVKSGHFVAPFSLLVFHLLESLLSHILRFLLF